MQEPKSKNKKRIDQMQELPAWTRRQWVHSIQRACVALEYGDITVEQAYTHTRQVNCLLKIEKQAIILAKLNGRIKKRFKKLRDQQIS